MQPNHSHHMIYSESFQFKSFNQNYYEDNQKRVDYCGLVNPIYLDCIDAKAQNTKYTSTVDFMNDIKWICHNVNIIDSGKRLHIYDQFLNLI